MAARLQISVFASVDGNYSIDRYAREFAAAIPPEFEVRIPPLKAGPGIVGKILDKRWRYAKLAKRLQGDLNIIVSEGYAFLLGSVAPERTVVVCHDVHPLIEQKHRGFWPSILRGEFRRLLYVRNFRANLRRMAAARLVVAVSEHTRQDLLKYCPWFPAEKVVVVHSGLSQQWKRVGDEATLSALRRKYGLEGKRVILHVGNDNWYKNFGGLLEAFAQLRNKADVVLLKVGDIGPQNQRRLRTLELANRVVHIRSAADSDLRGFYSLAALLAFPSLHEGFGWPPLEAMACGCPVVTSRGGSLAEVCGDACLYADPKDPRDLASAITRLLYDATLRREVIEKGLQRAQEFSWQGTASRIIDAARTDEIRPDQGRA